MNVAADSRWRLRDGSRLDRLADLPGDLQKRLAPAGGDAPPPDSGVLSRSGGRAAPVLLDPDAAALLEQFDDGKSVAQAVLDLARAGDLDPHELLEASLPAVRRLVGKGYLIDADAPPSALGYEVGDEVQGSAGTWRIARVIHRLEDSEIHLVCRVAEGSDAMGLSNDWGVLKLSTPERKFGRPEPEAEILRQVAARCSELGEPSVATDLLDEGGGEEAPGWIVLELVTGTAIHLRARGVRKYAAPGVFRTQLATLCAAAARAFASLHRTGVAHGDVHPDNLLVTGSDAQPQVRLIDLGCARRLDDGREHSSRPGIDLYREPEAASAMREGRRSPAATPAGEQYALAVVLYQLVTGHDYLDFSADRDELLRQVVEDAPRSFHEAGAGSWPEMESALHRALRKDPDRRYDSMDAFAEALVATQPEPSQEESGVESGIETLTRAASRAVHKAEPGGDWWIDDASRTLPRALFFGTAGLAWGLLHAAVRRGDADGLARAELWAQKALRDASDEEDGAPPVGTEGFPRLDSGPFHGPAGAHEAAACVAWAMGDLRRFVRHTKKFLRASNELAETGLSDSGFSDSAERDLDVDLALGRPGSLISAAHLLDRARPPHPDGSVASTDEVGQGREDRFGLANLATDLRTYGDELLDSLWRRLDERPEMAHDDSWLGMAHGWAGTLYATLVWCRAAGRDLPSGCATRLEELADLALPFGRGVRWTRERVCRSVGSAAGPVAGHSSMPGWCHGSAGYVLLFHKAARRPEYTEFRSVAEAAGWDVWDRFVAAPKQASHLCCGLVGQAWSLLVHARETGDDAWIHRARVLAESAVRRPVFDRPSEAAPDFFDGALFKGEGSLPALLADLECPQEAVWPWLEDLEELAPGAGSSSA